MSIIPQIDPSLELRIDEDKSKPDSDTCQVSETKGPQYELYWYYSQSAGFPIIYPRKNY